MTTRAKVELVAGILVLVACLVGFRAWLAEHDARLKSESDATAQKAIASKADDLIKQLRDADKERAAQTAAEVARAKDDAAKQVTAAQIAAWIPKQIPNTPQPITVNIPPATVANPKPDAIANIPQADMPALRDYISGCQVSTLQLSSCQKGLASRDEQLKQSDVKLTAMTNQRNDLQDELKGGTFFTRVKKAGKWILFGALAAGAAVCGTGHCK